MASDLRPGWATLALDAGGRSLIEASAGTGKTWTIAVLYLRLLLEAPGWSPRQIVVTTFTDAAAQELRERIRAALVAAERRAGQALARAHTPISTVDDDGDGTSEGGTGAAGNDDRRDPAERWLDARWQLPAAIVADRLRLKLALAELDQAPIGTLHALCRRVLAEHPFESGCAITLGSTIDGSELDGELADDAWRRLVQAPDIALGDLRWLHAGRKALRQCLRAVLQPGVDLAPEVYRQSDAFDRDAVLAELHDWNRVIRPNPRSRVLARGLARLAAVLERGEPLDALDGAALDDLLSPLDKAVLADDHDRAQAHPLAMFLDRLRHAREPALARYRTAALAERARRLAARDQLGFDDLIVRVHAAIEAEPALADALFADWPVALVDEFQDTDDRQFRILDRIYRSGDGAQRGRLVMIGDPKQAIYRFRGGDIGAYQRAAATAAERMTLGTNFRSADRYVGALNQLFAAAGPQLSSRPGHPIACHHVDPSGRRSDTALTIDGRAVERPLQLHLATDLPAAQGERERRALVACADHIATVLDDDRHAIGGRRVAPGDLAVLLPTNQQIATLRRLLQQRGVPCVGSARSSVFASDWARELQIVLHAAWHPRDSGAVRAALACRLVGLGFVELAGLDDDPVRWQRESGRFDLLHRRWQQSGVLAVIRELIADAAPRLLASGDGERALTDLRHLGELLQAASDTLAGGPALLAWLQRQRDGEDAGDDTAAEERSLRIESDARRVTLMTLHASKGLEFPIVFLPLMWKHEARSRESFWLVDDGAGHRLLSFDRAMAKPVCDEDAQDERFRVLYVALTRAIHACHVYALPWDRPASAAKNAAAPADPARSALDALLERLHAHGGPAAIEARCPHIACTTGWPWRRPERSRFDTPDRSTRHALAMPRLPTRYLQVHSFSTLVRPAPRLLEAGVAADEEVLDATASEWTVDPAPATATTTVGTDRTPHPELFALAELRGTEFGNALHAIFEHRAIGQPMAAQHALIRNALRDHGVRLGAMPLDRAVDLLAHRVQACLDAEILPGLALAALPADALRAEMAFHYPIDGVTLAALRHACDANGAAGLVPVGRLPALHGLMTGKIDLVLRHDGRFHVLDYKGNRLGDPGHHLADYAPSALETAMDHSHYRFQALLYTVAVDRLLRQRLPGYRRDRQLGDAIYLFVRAVGLAPGAGIWRHRFGDALIDAVDAVLAGSHEDTA